VCDLPFGWLLRLKLFVWQAFWQQKKELCNMPENFQQKNPKTLVSLSLKATAACGYFPFVWGVCTFADSHQISFP
jgi:hypothetical protein